MMQIDSELVCFAGCDRIVAQTRCTVSLKCWLIIIMPVISGTSALHFKNRNKQVQVFFWHTFIYKFSSAREMFF